MPEYMQHETRQNYTFHDDHGRPYLAIVDTRTKPHLAPCTPLQAQYTAPIMPQGVILSPHPQRLGTLVVDYLRWEDDAERDWSAFQQHQAQVAERMFGDDATRAIRENDPRLVSEVGPPPIHPDFVRAAAGGKSPWVLGLAPADQVPDWAKPILHTLPQYRPQTIAQRTSGGQFEDTFTAETAEPKTRRRTTPDLAGV